MRWNRRRKAIVVLLSCLVLFLCAWAWLTIWYSAVHADYAEHAVQWMMVTFSHSCRGSASAEEADGERAAMLYDRACTLLEHATKDVDVMARPSLASLESIEGWPDAVGFVKSANGMPYALSISCSADQRAVLDHRETVDRYSVLVYWMNYAANAHLATGNIQEALLFLEEGAILSDRIGNWANNIRMQSLDEDLIRTYLSIVMQNSVASAKLPQSLKRRAYRQRMLEAWMARVLRDEVLPSAGESWLIKRAYDGTLMPWPLRRALDWKRRRDYLVLAQANLFELGRPYYEMELKSEGTKYFSPEDIQEYLNILNGRSFRAASMEAAVLLCRAATHARQYYVRNGKYPESLAEWIDPVTGQPIEYHQTEDGILIRTGGRDFQGNVWEFRCN